MAKSKARKKVVRKPRKSPSKKGAALTTASYKNEKPTKMKSFVGVFLKVCKVITDIAAIIKAFRLFF